jgi:hypothetical protein
VGVTFLIKITHRVVLFVPRRTTPPTYTEVNAIKSNLGFFLDLDYPRNLLLDFLLDLNYPRNLLFDFDLLGAASSQHCPKRADAQSTQKLAT